MKVKYCPDTFVALVHAVDGPKVLRKLPRYEKMRVWEADPEMRRLIEIRFNAHVDHSSGPNSCWPYVHLNGTPYSSYGSFMICGQAWRAPRIAFWLAHGYLPKELDIRHSCDNPPCVNPSHLELGTEQDNNDDDKRRNRFTRGRTILNPDIVRAIRKEYIPFVVSTNDLAAKYGISQTQIWSIVRRISWSWIE